MKTLLTIVALLVLTFNGSAQILQNVKNTAKNKVQNQDFNTGRSNKEKSGLTNKKSESAPASSPMPGSGTEAPEESSSETDSMTATSSALNYQKEYSFNMKIAYDITNLKKNETSNLAYSFSDNAMYTVMKENESSMINDYVNEVMITIDDKSKSATVMSSSWSNKMAGKMIDNHNEKAGNTTVTKTGKTKVILGRNCDEYLATSEDGTKINMWITTDIIIDNAKIAASMMQYSKTSQPTGDYPAGGTMMEFTSYNKKGEAETHMIMTDYSETTFVKNLSDYRITTIGF